MQCVHFHRIQGPFSSALNMLEFEIKIEIHKRVTRSLSHVIGVQISTIANNFKTCKERFLKFN